MEKTYENLLAYLKKEFASRKRNEENIRSYYTSGEYCDDRLLDQLCMLTDDLGLLLEKIEMDFNDG